MDSQLLGLFVGLFYFDYCSLFYPTLPLNVNYSNPLFTIQPLSHSMLVEVVNAVREWPLFALCNGRDIYHYSHGGRRIMMDIFPASMSMTIEFAHPQAEEPVSRPLMAGFICIL